MMKFGDEDCMTTENFRIAAYHNTFVEKQFDFPIPQDITTAIENLKEAVLDNSALLDCYLEEFRAVVHWNTDEEDGITEEQGEELIDYYYRRRYAYYD